jgi:hypothetical protein
VQVVQVPFSPISPVIVALKALPPTIYGTEISIVDNTRNISSKTYLMNMRRWQMPWLDEWVQTLNSQGGTSKAEGSLRRRNQRGSDRVPLHLEHSKSHYSVKRKMRIKIPTNRVNDHAVSDVYHDFHAPSRCSRPVDGLAAAKNEWSCNVYQ